MKFMEAVATQEGEGRVVARAAEGGLLVAMEAREMRVERRDGKVEVKWRPGPNLIMQRCELHKSWYHVECVKCKND